MGRCLVAPFSPMPGAPFQAILETEKSQRNKTPNRFLHYLIHFCILNCLIVSHFVLNAVQWIRSCITFSCVVFFVGCFVFSFSFIFSAHLLVVRLFHDVHAAADTPTDMFKRFSLSLVLCSFGSSLIYASFQCSFLTFAFLIEFACNIFQRSYTHSLSLYLSDAWIGGRCESVVCSIFIDATWRFVYSSGALETMEEIGLFAFYFFFLSFWCDVA